jgi:hypothetical protein
LQDAYELKQEIEAEYQDMLGEAVFDQLRATLRQLLAHPAAGGEAESDE